MSERAAENARMRAEVNEEAFVDGIVWDGEAWARNVAEFESGNLEAVNSMIAQLETIKDDFLPNDAVEIVLSDEFLACVRELFGNVTVVALKLLEKLVFVSDEFAEKLVDSGNLVEIWAVLRNQDHSEENLCGFLGLFAALLEDSPHSRSAMIDLGIIDFCVSMIGRSPALSLSALQCIARMFVRMDAYNNALPTAYTIPVDGWARLLLRVREYTEQLLTMEDRDFVRISMDSVLDLIMNRECVATGFAMPIQAGFPGLFLQFILTGDPLAVMDSKGVMEVVMWIRHVFISVCDEALYEICSGFDTKLLAVMASDDPLWSEIHTRFPDRSVTCISSIFARMVLLDPVFAQTIVESGGLLKFVAMAPSVCFKTKRELAYLVSAVILAIPVSQLQAVLTEEMVALFEVITVEPRFEQLPGMVDSRNFHDMMAAAITRINDSFPDDSEVKQQLAELVDLSP